MAHILQASNDCMSLDTYFICGVLPKRSKHSFAQIVTFIRVANLGMADRWYAANSADDWSKDADDDAHDGLIGGNDISVDLGTITDHFTCVSPKGAWSLIWRDAIPDEVVELCTEDPNFDGWCPTDLELACGPQLITDGLNEKICYRGRLSLRLSGGGSPPDFDKALMLLEDKFKKTDIFLCFAKHFGGKSSFALTCR